MNSQYVGVCNNLPSKNLVNKKKYTFLTKKIKLKKKLIVLQL